MAVSIFLLSIWILIGILIISSLMNKKNSISYMFDKGYWTLYVCTYFTVIVLLMERIMFFARAEF